jgi:hypothetical protein
LQRFGIGGYVDVERVLVDGGDHQAEDGDDDEEKKKTTTTK